MDTQHGPRYPPSPVEIMERLENSMAEIDQMMAELRGSITPAPSGMAHSHDLGQNISIRLRSFLAPRSALNSFSMESKRKYTLI